MKLVKSIGRDLFDDLNLGKNAESWILHAKLAMARKYAKPGEPLRLTASLRLCVKQASPQKYSA
jgi:hypothetical protein